MSTITTSADYYGFMVKNLDSYMRDWEKANPYKDIVVPTCETA